MRSIMPPSSTDTDIRIINILNDNSKADIFSQQVQVNKNWNLRKKTKIKLAKQENMAENVTTMNTE